MSFDQLKDPDGWLAKQHDQQARERLAMERRFQKNDRISRFVLIVIALAFFAALTALAAWSATPADYSDSLSWEGGKDRCHAITWSMMEDPCADCEWRIEVINPGDLIGPIGDYTYTSTALGAGVTEHKYVVNTFAIATIDDGTGPVTNTLGPCDTNIVIEGGPQDGRIEVRWCE